MSPDNTSRPFNSLFVGQGASFDDAFSNLDSNISISPPNDMEMFGDEYEPMHTELERYILSDSNYQSSQTPSQTTAGTSSYATPHGQDASSEVSIDPSLSATVPSQSIDQPMHDMPSSNELPIDPALTSLALPTASVEQPGAQIQPSNNHPTAITDLPSTEAVAEAIGHPTGQPAEQVAPNRQPSPEWRDLVERVNSQSPDPFGPVRPRRGASRQGGATRGGRRGRGRGRGRVNTADAVHDPRPFYRYPPMDHNPPPENRAGRTRERSRDGRAPPEYVPQNLANSAPSEPNPMGNVRPGEDQEPRAMIWVDAARFDLLLQVAYERRHETLSESAWRRIATGCHGGPFRDASWNAVRLEFSRLMRDRFPGYGQDSPLADNRRRLLNSVAHSQGLGRITRVSPAELDHNVTDASTICPRPRTSLSRTSNSNTAQHTRGGTVQAGSNHAEYSSHAEAHHSQANGNAPNNGEANDVDPGTAQANPNNNGENNVNEASNAALELASNGLPYTRELFR